MEMSLWFDCSRMTDARRALLTQFCVGSKESSPTVKAIAPPGIDQGDLVEVSVDDSIILKATAIMYGVPLVAFLAGVLGGYGFSSLAGLTGNPSMALPVVTGFVMLDSRHHPFTQSGHATESHRYCCQQTRSGGGQVPVNTTAIWVLDIVIALGMVFMAVAALVIGRKLGEFSKSLSATIADVQGQADELKSEAVRLMQSTQVTEQHFDQLTRQLTKLTASADTVVKALPAVASGRDNGLLPRLMSTVVGVDVGVQVFQDHLPEEEIMSERNDCGSFMGGLLMGSIVGALVALVLAPQSGEETRKLLKDKAFELGKEISDQTETLKEKGRELLTQDGIEIGESTDTNP